MTHSQNRQHKTARPGLFHRRIFPLSLTLCFLASLPLFAERTRRWRQSTYDDFLKGTAHGVAVRSDRVTLSINGTAAPLLSVSPDQINAQVPFEVTEGWATAVLQLADMAPVPIGFPIAAAAPAIFTHIQNQSAVRNADGSQNTPDNPASVGSPVTVYLTGQGAVAPPVSTGEPAPSGTLARAIYPVTATVGHRPATITFAGLSPGSVGLFQINLVVPPIGTGLQPLVVTVNGVSSNTGSVSVSGRRPLMGSPQ